MNLIIVILWVLNSVNNTYFGLFRAPCPWQADAGYPRTNVLMLELGLRFLLACLKRIATGAVNLGSSRTVVVVVALSAPV